MNLLHHFRQNKFKIQNSKFKIVRNFAFCILNFALISMLASDQALAQRPIELLEPIGNTTQIMVTGNPLSALNQYLQPFMPLIIGASAGLAVLMIILGGFQIMLSGGAIAQSAGKDRILAALLGLSLLVFSAVILYMLNSNFFVLT